MVSTIKLQFPTKCLDDPGVFLLIVSAVDPYQLEHIQFSIMTGETVMLGAGVFDLLGKLSLLVLITLFYAWLKICLLPK